MDILDTARLLRFQTDWERRFHDYWLLTEAGINPEEALRIASQTEADRAHVDVVGRKALLDRQIAGLRDMQPTAA